MIGRAQVKAEASFMPSMSYLPERTSLSGDTPTLKKSLSSQKDLVSNPLLIRAIQRFPCYSCLFPIQAKLTINKPGDQYEQEADRIADQVVRMAESHLQRQEYEEKEDEMVRMKPLEKRIAPLVQRKEVPQEEDVEEETIQAKVNSGHVSLMTPQIEAQMVTMRGEGRPLPTYLRNFFEPRLGFDLSRVRVHYDPEATRLARSIHARAFTIGQDIVFGIGQYMPETRKGRRLLAHELAHVIQQSKINLLRRENLTRFSGNFETNANHMAMLGKSRRSIHVEARSSPPSIQRQKRRGKGVQGQMAYQGAEVEAETLRWALDKGDSKFREYVMNRFYGFNPIQMAEVMNALQQRSPTDIAGLGVDAKVRRNPGATNAKDSSFPFILEVNGLPCSCDQLLWEQFVSGGHWIIDPHGRKQYYGIEGIEKIEPKSRKYGLWREDLLKGMKSGPKKVSECPDCKCDGRRYAFRDAPGFNVNFGDIFNQFLFDGIQWGSRIQHKLWCSGQKKPFLIKTFRLIGSQFRNKKDNKKIIEI